MSESKPNPWSGLRDDARTQLETRDYSMLDPGSQLSGPGMPAGQVLDKKDELKDHWIPGVEFFRRRVFQQNGRGYFSELTRLNEGKLDELGLAPQQWASALMHRDSSKGFHIHPPHIPEGVDAAEWFQDLYVKSPEDYSKRPYDKEQWDVMFFLTGICEMILVDEREGMPRRVMRFTIAGDSRPGPDNMAVVIPPGVGHALRDIGNEDLIMVYGTSTTFNPAWEGRVASDVEKAPLPGDWERYLEDGPV
ncbi:hypothetical protein [Haloferula sp.]|uniref:hypothetical protein n=1 Tax=Haloferula sp. TaxID=2497595 RepID=UPI0032A14031